MAPRAYPALIFDGHTKRMWWKSNKSKEEGTTMMESFGGTWGPSYRDSNGPNHPIIHAGLIREEEEDFF